jgi:2-polyprenyl-6-methoxyphenol hydroxylase-like FAD-dependent oxidoreductase
LLDGQPRAARRLAGEWLHPAGVEVLRQLGVELPGSVPAGQGFVVFPEAGGAPIILHYPTGQLALTCEHAALVAALRQAAAAQPNIRWLSAARATGIEGQRIHYRCPERGPGELRAPLIVGADGRSSLARASLGLASERTLVSGMAGILLEDTTLPFEGFGHVILGGPGPVLAYRVGPRHVRLLLDVPARRVRLTKDVTALEQAYGSVLPPELAESFRQALKTGPIAWASNQWRAREHYGRDGLALVGDAVGHFHPLTAVGMTVGFLDGACLAESRDFADYRKARGAGSRVPELLAISLYKVLTRTDDATVALRSALYDVWRNDPAECRRTMLLLSAAETDPTQFRQAFLRVLTLAGQRVVSEMLRSRHWRRTLRTLGGFGEWLFWLATDALRRRQPVSRSRALTH